MGQKYQNFVNEICNLAKANKGVAVIEVWPCTKCYAECFLIHNMQESIRCPHCGHRRGSQLARYQSACEAGAEAEVAFFEPAYNKPHG